MNNASSQSSSGTSAIKVMIVDDSAVIRGFLGKILASSEDIQITSIAANGQSAIQNLVKQKHDIILLDVDMPVMDGLAAIPRLLEVQHDVKILMCSTLTTKNAETSLRALALGAVECIAKPSSTQDIYSKDNFRETLIRTIHDLMGAHVFKPIGLQPTRSATTPPPAARPDTTAHTAAPSPSSLQTQQKPAFASPQKTVTLKSGRDGYAGKPEVLIIGSSTGGPNALFKLFASLRGIDVPVMLTQHMPPTFTKILAEHITQQSGIPAVEGEDGMPLVAGRIHVAPGGFHMLAELKGATPVIRINDGPMENFCRPAVDPMFRSAVKIFGQKIMAVILTGMGQDGMLGARDVAQAGGRVIAQDEATSVVWGMPGAAAMDGTCSAVLPLDEIGPWLRKQSLRLP